MCSNQWMTVCKNSLIKVVTRRAEVLMTGTESPSFPLGTDTVWDFLFPAKTKAKPEMQKGIFLLMAVQ